MYSANVTVSDTVTINPSAYTIEQAGSIYLPAADTSFSVNEYRNIVTSSVVDDFPSPPVTVFTTNTLTGDLTVSMDFSGGTFSFDTGLQPLVWNGSCIDWSSHGLHHYMQRKRIPTIAVHWLAWRRI